MSLQKSNQAFVMTRGDPGSKENMLEVLKLFRIIFKSTTQHFAEVEKAAGIGGASLWALAEISATSNLTVSELAKAMSIHPSTASNLLEKLEVSGHVVRIRSATDRRVVNLSLTDKGRDVLTKAPQPYSGILPDVLMRLNPALLEQLQQDLKRLVSLLERKNKRSAYEPLGR
jgi:DNA-binding MarR family transcriptional regulator